MYTATILQPLALEINKAVALQVLLGFPHFWKAREMKTGTNLSDLRTSTHTQK
jgi:hypothetical protein